MKLQTARLFCSLLEILNCRVKIINNGVHEHHRILEMCFFESPEGFLAWTGWRVEQRGT